MRIPSGVTDQYIYFMAVDSTDYVTPETGLSSFTVRRSRNGGASAAYTTPTINETDSSNMPGVYELLLDEDMALDAGDHSQEVCLRITHAGMAPVTLKFELYRPDVTAGQTLNVASGVGEASVQSAAANSLTASALASDAVAEIQSGLATAAAVATLDGVADAILLDTAEIGAAGAGLTALASASDLAAVFNLLNTEIADILADTGTTIPALIAALPTADGNADALLDRAAGVETGWTLRQAMRIVLAALAGKASGLGTTTATYRDMADSKDRISATVTADGDRTTVTRDAT